MATATAATTHMSEGHGADSAEAGPSPTESYGCEPHDDHW